MKNKIKMLFDGNILICGADKNSGRSGIYFTALNILNEFSKHPEIEITLFCSRCNLDKINFVLKEKFNKNFNIFLSDYINTKTDFYNTLKMFKNKAKENNEPVFKFLLQMLIFIFGLENRIKKLIFQLKRTLMLRNINTFFSPIYTPPNFIRRRSCIKKYLMLYDLTPVIFPEYFPWVKGSWYEELLEFLNEKDYYFAISKYTMQDFLKYSNKINPSHIYDTLLACSENFRPDKENIDKVKKKYNIPENKKYIFSLCTLEPRKNLIRAVKTFIEFIKEESIDDLVFVLGGGYWEEFIGRIKEEITSLGSFETKIIRAGYVDDEDLPCLYSNAEWFVYTSQYEGFGLPPLEAMSCGCPVITSNNSSLPEVTGDAGIMIDYDSDKQHIEAYKKYYYDEKFRKETALKGLERSKEFSWKKCADKMLEVMAGNLNS